MEEAQRRGLLTTARLMGGAGAVADWVGGARPPPTLKVGLHLMLVEGRPVLPPREIPDLVDGRGEFSTCLVGAGLNFFFRPGVRRQLEAEIRAQFEAFTKTGLPLDHVNAHNHMHVHPTVLGLILKVGRDYGLKAVRVPYEPLLPSWRASGTAFFSRSALWLFMMPWSKLLKARLRRAGVRSNEYVFGLNDIGQMDVYLVLQMIRHLPHGVTEMHFHSANRRSP